MAPEILKEATGKIGAPCDVYSFSMVMWEILMRDSVWKGVNWVKVTSMVVNGKRPELSPLPAEYSKDDFANKPQFLNFTKVR